MAIRSGHGNGAGVPRIEVLPPDELPDPAPIPDESGPIVRRSNGTFADGESARRAGRKGGQRTQLFSRILRSLGLAELSADHAFYAYEVAGKDFADAYISRLTTMFGECGEGPASIVKTAGIQLASSRYLYDQGKLTGDAELLGQASKMGNDHRQNMLASYELAAREAQAREASVPDGVDAHWWSDKKGKR